MRFKRGKLVSLLMSFLYAGYAQAYQDRKSRSEDSENYSCEMPKELDPLFKILGFTYVCDPLWMHQADNKTGDTGGSGGGTGNIGAPYVPGTDGKAPGEDDIEPFTDFEDDGIPYDDDYYDYDYE